MENTKTNKRQYYRKYSGTVTGKIVFLLLAVLALFCAGALSAAGEEGMTEPAGVSVPRLMVTSYRLEGTLTSRNTADLSVTLTNTHKTQAVENIRVSFSSEAVLAAKNASVFVESLAPGASYVWRFSVTASNSVSSGKYPATISTEYESKEGESFTSSDTLTIAVTGNGSAETTLSQPRLMVTKYELENQWIVPGEDRNLTITIENKNKTTAAKNIKLTLAEGNGEVLFSGTGTAFIDSLKAGGSYTWKVAASAIPTATVGEKTVTLTAEYEDSAGTLCTSSDTLRLSVRQPPELTWDGAILPEQMVQGETVSVTVNLMNSGKSELNNCTIRFSVDSLITDGSIFVGSLAPGESKPGVANLRADESKVGESKGTVVISYEDAYGEAHEETVDLSTTIVKKVETLRAEAEEEPATKYPLWWLFLLVGLLAGGGAGFGIPYAIHLRKQRLQDEERL